MAQVVEEVCSPVVAKLYAGGPMPGAAGMPRAGCMPGAAGMPGAGPMPGAGGKGSTIEEVD